MTDETLTVTLNYDTSHDDTDSLQYSDFPGGYNIQLSFSIGTGPEWKNGYSGLVPNGKKAIRDWCLSPIFLY